MELDPTRDPKSDAWSQAIDSVDPDVRRSAHREAQRLTGDAGSADDVLQDAWLIARKGGNSDRSGGWLRGVARRLGLSERRRSKQRAARERLAAANESTDATPLDDLLRRDTIRAVREAINGLDEPMRSAIRMRYIEGRPIAEVSTALRRPEATVKSQIHRGLSKLRVVLLRAGAGPGVAIAVLNALQERAEATPVAPRPGPALGQNTRALSMAGTACAAAIVGLIGAAALLGWKARTHTSEVEPRLAEVAAIDIDASTPAPHAGALRTATPAEHQLVGASGVETPPASAATPAAVRARLAQLRVIDDGGVPVANADVFIGFGVSTLAAATTDEAGRASVNLADYAPVTRAIAGVSQPRYELVVRAEGLTRSRRWLLSVDDTDDSPTIDVSLARAATTIGGTVLMPGGQRAPGASVRVVTLSNGRGVGANGIPCVGDELIAQADERGRFAITGVPAGAYSVRATLPGFGAGLGATQARAGEVSDCEIRLQDPCAHDIVIHDERGQPVSGATIRLYPHPWTSLGATWSHSVPEIPIVAITDVDGCVRLEDLPAGKATVEVESNRGGARASVRLTSEVIDRSSLTLGTAAPLEIQAVDARGAPIAGLRVDITDPATYYGRYVRTDADGVARAAGAPQAVQVTISTSSHPVPLAARRLDENSPRQIALQCDPDRQEGVLRGTLELPAAIKCGAIRIAARHVVYGTSSVVRVAPETGEFETPPLPAGQYDLIVRSSTAGRVVLTTIDHDGADTMLETLTVPPPATVTIAVDWHERPDVSVQLRHAVRYSTGAFGITEIAHGIRDEQSTWQLFPGFCAVLAKDYSGKTVHARKVFLTPGARTGVTSAPGSLYPVCIECLAEAEVVAYELHRLPARDAIKGGEEAALRSACASTRVSGATFDRSRSETATTVNQTVSASLHCGDDGGYGLVFELANGDRRFEWLQRAPGAPAPRMRFDP